MLTPGSLIEFVIHQIDLLIGTKRTPQQDTKLNNNT